MPVATKLRTNDRRPKSARASHHITDKLFSFVTLFTLEFIMLICSYIKNLSYFNANKETPQQRAGYHLVYPTLLPANPASLVSQHVPYKTAAPAAPDPSDVISSGETNIR